MSRSAAGWFLTGDVAREAGISSEMVRFLERAGKLRAIRTVRGTRLFDPADVARLVAERRARIEHSEPEQVPA